jgi:6-pyruvoyltetrahydropterin/6-carboxytetrahydropterin synthase
MADKYHVRLEKEQLTFSAAHFITFNGDICERLHGHNYRVMAEVRGRLDENHYVIDFIALRDTLQEITTELDHHMLLPTDHDQIKVVANGSEVNVSFQDRRWVFPRDDCVLLPLANTTTELLARYIGNQLVERLRKRTGAALEQVTVGVDENEGQWGFCELDLTSS